MNKNALANSLAVLSLASYALCVLATFLFPELLMTLFNSWFHGVDLTVLGPSNGDWVLGTGNLVLGLVTFPIFSWIVGYSLASLYNYFSHNERPKR